MNCFVICLLVFSLQVSLASTTNEYIKINSVEFKDNEISPTLISAIENKQLILIGESHGTNEMPDFTYSLVKVLAEKHEIALGLEFPIEIQEPIDAFMASGDEKVLADILFFKDANFHSGRGSEAMIRMLKNVRTIKKLKVFCFDSAEPNFTSPSPVERDTRMAMNILGFIKANPNKKIITYSGNIHSRLTPGYANNPNHKNMGAETLKFSNGNLTLSNSINILFRYDQGSAWQCWFDTDKKIICGSRSFGPYETIYASSLPFNRYFLQEPEITDGHFESVFIRSISA